MAMPRVHGALPHRPEMARAQATVEAPAMNNDAQHRELFAQRPWLYPPGTNLEPESYEAIYYRAYVFARCIGVKFPHLYATTATFKEGLQ